MNKKSIFWISLAVLVVIIWICMHYFPLWVSGVTILSFAGGCVVGWVGRILYNKYIKEGTV